MSNAVASPSIKFKKKKVLTRPVLKLIEDQTIYIKIVGEMHLGKDIKKKKDDEKEKDPATLIDVINLLTGEEEQIIASAVIKSVLEDNYPDKSYVNKCFAMTKMARQPGKQYNPVHIDEIEEPTPSNVVAPTEEGAKPVVEEPVIGQTITEEKPAAHKKRA